MEETKRICCKCKDEKALSEFSKDKNSSTGYTYACKKCRNEQYNKFYKDNPDKALLKNLKQVENRKRYYQSERGFLSSRRAHLKRSFNITLEDYNTLSERQNHLCYICNKPEESERNSVLSVDHCHETSIIRGLLCTKCNTGLGLFQDNIDYLSKAIEYLTINKNI